MIKKYSVGIVNSVRSQQEIIQVLSEDLKKILINLQDNPFNFWLRSYFRSYFALVEGISYGLKQIALSVHEEEPCFTNAEVSLLNEVTYEINDKGDAQERIRYLDTLANIKFSFNSIIKAFRVNINIDYGYHGWASFQQLIKIRNQITHPKDVKLLNIINNDEEKKEVINLIIEASQWYSNQIGKILTEITSAVK